MKKLKKSQNSILFGVCGGLGEYFEIDPIVFRLAFFFLGFLWIPYFVLVAVLD